MLQNRKISLFKPHFLMPKLQLTKNIFLTPHLAITAFNLETIFFNPETVAFIGALTSGLLYYWSDYNFHKKISVSCND